MSVSREATSLSPALVKRIFAAVRNGHANELSKYAEMGGDLNLFDHDGWTMLMHTIPHNQPAMAAQLLALGANPDLPDAEDNLTALYRAAAKGNVDIVGVLLEAAANTEMGDSEGQTPLAAAVMEMHHACVERLLEGGADVNAQNGEGGTPLYLCARYGEPHTMHLLLEWGADPNIATSTGLTPLIAAAWVGSDEKTARLLEAGADITAQDDRGRTALSIARARGFDEVAELLQNAGG
jgi:uncharacterized protein